MRLGTPLSPQATKVMMLGAGELGKEVVIALQRLGVEVIAVDRYDNAPAQQVAHSSHTIDMTDGKALRALVEQVKPTMIVPEIEAIATDELGRIEADHLCEIIPTALATQLTMNREGIRCLAAEDLGLATSKYGFANSVEQLADIVETTTGLPAIVKPVMSSSGKGQSMIKTKEDIQKAWDIAQSGGRVSGGRVIVEETIQFDYEITLLTVRALGEEGTIETHFCDPVGHVQQDGDYIESWQPQPMSPKALALAQEMAKAVTDKLGGWGLFGVELFVKGDQVWFSEVSPRPHDTGMVTMATQRQNEFELHARAILGLPVDAKAHSAGASAVIYGELDQAGISFEGVEKAMAVKGVDIRLFGKPESFKRRRMGVAVAYGKTIERARDRAKKAASLVKPVAPKV